MESPRLNRRDVLKVGLVGSAAAAIPFQSVLKAGDASEIDEGRLPVPYRAPFSVPPVMAPTASDDTPGNTYGTVDASGEPVVGPEYAGTDYYRIVQRPTQVEICPGIMTTMWGYNGLVPGPTIRTYRRGGKPRRLVMQQINQLPARHPTLGYVPWTSTHLHGSPSKPQYDGYAGDLTHPGEWKNYHYPNHCTPRTLWYHDHGVHHTAENVYMGLAAQYHVVDEALEASLGIPRYRRDWADGHPQYDIPLTLTDVMFAANGQLMWDDDSQSGLYGDVILVNGRPWPTMKVEPRKYRFRVLNACLARGFTLTMSNGMPFQIIATDAGFMRNPQTVTRVVMGMSERLECVIDFAGLQGTNVQLLNLGVENARDFTHTGKVMQFEVGTTVTSTEGNSVPSVLDPNPPVMDLTPAMASATRHMDLGRTGGEWTINDMTWDDVVRSGYQHVFANPAPNAVEIWEVTNSSGGWFHPLHVHLVDFQVLDRNGQPPRPEERGPKDTVYVGEEETVRILMRFDHEEGRYMIHCHNLSHEDHDMMTQYQVGHHDLDCDPINAAPARSGTPEPLGTATTTPTTSSSSTTSSSTTSSSTTAPSSTSSSSTTAPSSTTSSSTTAPSSTTSSSTTTAAPRTTRARKRTSKRRRRGTTQ